MSRTLLTIFLISHLFFSSLCTSIIERKAETQAEIEENTVFIACLYLSRSYIRTSKRETETSFANLRLSQDRLYIKLLALTFIHCKQNIKLEETYEIIESWMDGADLEISKYNDLMNPELRYEDIYEAFELSEMERETLKNIEEVDTYFRKNLESEKQKKREAQRLLELKNQEERLNWIVGQNLWKVLYVFLICLIIGGCFILLFTGFSLSGKMDGLEKEDETFGDANDVLLGGNGNQGGNKRKENK